MNTKVIIVFVSTCLKWAITHDFKNHLVADENDMYHLFWSIDGENVTFEVQVATKGYVGFGFSSNGTMPGSDIVMGWILPNGQAYFNDRHALGYYEPLIDTEQNYNLINAYENDTHTVLRFTRKLNTCDKENDAVITDSTMKMIYSWHPDDPNTIASVHYHGPNNRGAKSNYFLSPPIPPLEITDDITIWEIQIPNVTITPKNTTFICFYAKYPPLEKSYYYVGFDIQIPPAIEDLLHHVIIYECVGNSTFFEEEYNQKKNGYECENFSQFPRPNCTSKFITWGKGGKGQFYPKGFGRRLLATYFFTQLHYTNFAYKQGLVDRTKIRVYLSKTEMTSKSGVIMMKVIADYRLLIPPQLPAFQISTYCPTECTSMSLPKEGINLFAAFGHSHLRGRKFSLRHFRDNKELKPIMEDTNYDFLYEEIRYLPEVVKIMPGDMLMGTCVYSSMEQNETVVGGQATTEEMCFFDLRYYPDVNLKFCSWIPNYEEINQYFGVNEVAEDKVHIISPVELQNQTIIDVIKHYNWTTVDEAKMGKLMSMLYDADKNISCSSEITMAETEDIIIPVSYPTDIPPYIPPSDVCGNTSDAVYKPVLGT